VKPVKSAEAPGLYWAGQPQGHLPDVNVWLALAYEQHPFHASALHYWQSVQIAPAVKPNPSPSLWFCRLTMMGLVRLLCQPAVMQADVQTLTSSWTVYQNFMALPFVGLLHEAVHVDQRLAGLITPDLSARHLTDACLLATAQASGLKLVSFDQGFKQFAGAEVLILGM
jgi:uncharacterized protein